ncbi:hypothetical protein QUF72_08715 [Desulfobacterales bacterium HSG2]|nr:hypothetical protein [Desulfobacterales bacterium HSG2]
MKTNINIKNFDWKKALPEIISIIMMISLLGTGTAVAHRITVFAWVEGDIVHVESKFSGGKKVRGGEVIVSDSRGNPLLNGKTNDQGEFSFKAPQKAAMKIAVIAGMGHRGEWTIATEEIEGPAAEETVKSAREPAPDRPEKHTEALSSPGLSPDDIQSVVEKALDKKLKPVIKMLKESRQDDTPSFTDILGGIGYILGLMGIAAYFNFRRKE